MPSHQVRRATTDDLPQLVQLLKVTLLPADVLEKRFTEFQVVEATGGKLIGAIGLQIANKHGKIHSETYTDFSLSDTLRPVLMERLKNVAQNHGLVRLWTQETAPYWRQNGFDPADDDAKKKFPPMFGDVTQNWLTLKLKEELEEILSADKEFATFMESEKQRTEQMLAQAKFFHFVAYLLGGALFLFSLGVLIYTLIKRKSGF